MSGDELARMSGDELSQLFEFQESAYDQIACLNLKSQPDRPLPYVGVANRTRRSYRLRALFSSSMPALTPTFVFYFHFEKNRDWRTKHPTLGCPKLPPPPPPPPNSPRRPPAATLFLYYPIALLPGPCIMMSRSSTKADMGPPRVRTRLDNKTQTPATPTPKQEEPKGAKFVPNPGADCFCWSGGGGGVVG
jgi:hypothetical protein